MYSKIIIRNVGVLKAFDAGSSPPLSKLSLFYARNGRGKSTLTAVMRAARNGCSSTVMARQSLGNNAVKPEITLVSSLGNRRFTDGQWGHDKAPIEVFDSAFIADNIFAGEMTELGHDKGLFWIIIGEEGVRLNKLFEKFSERGKVAASKLKTAEAALAEDLPTDINQEQFFALAANPAFASRLEKAQKTLKVVQDADKVALLETLEQVLTPSLPYDFDSALKTTVETIDSTARTKLADHFKLFKLGKDGEEWVNFGMEHVEDDSCPFCGRADVNELGTVSLYGRIFGREYKEHLASVNALKEQTNEQLGEELQSSISTTIAANSARTEKWKKYVQIEAALPTAEEIVSNVKEAHLLAQSLSDKKRQSPLEVISGEASLAKIETALKKASEQIASYNTIVDDINKAALAGKVAAVITEEDAQLEVSNTKRRIARTEDAGVQKRIEAYLFAKRRDKRVRDARAATQAKLKAANKSAASHYHARVNFYLGRFGVAAKITEPTNSMSGGGQSDYSLIIKGESVSRGRGRVETKPSFRTTLSSGDKSTLALAFFLAKLDQDVELAQKVVVFDDPLSSHDSHRRSKTVEAIKDLCGRCLQVITLSHDEYFLHDIEKRCKGTDIAPYQIEYAGDEEWSVAKRVNLTELCRSGQAKRIDELKAFLSERIGDPDHLVLCIRKVLETHFRRSYTAYFPHNRNLGQIVRDIDELGSAHPCHSDRDSLDTLNAATCDEHHGDDAIVNAKRGVDPDELRVSVADALLLIGAKRPTS